MEQDFDREWTQDELRSHCASMGYLPDPTEVIPQCVKYCSNEPLTQSEIERVRELIRTDKLGLNA